MASLACLLAGDPGSAQFATNLATVSVAVDSECIFSLSLEDGGRLSSEGSVIL